MHLHQQAVAEELQQWGGRVGGIVGVSSSVGVGHNMALAHQFFVRCAWCTWTNHRKRTVTLGLRAIWSPIGLGGGRGVGVSQIHSIACPHVNGVLQQNVVIRVAIHHTQNNLVGADNTTTVVKFVHKIHLQHT